MSQHCNVSSINQSVQKTQRWLSQLKEQGSFQSEEQAYSAFRAVLHSLRDRLTVDEATDLASQLPMVVRGFYYEGWRPSFAPNDEKTREDFYASIKESLKQNDTIDPERASVAVFGLLKQELTPGLTDHVRQMLPKDIQGLWEQ